MNTHFGTRLKEVRKDVKLTQEDFAREIGVKGPHISQLEKGKSNPSDQFIKSICHRFSVNEPWLVKGEGEKYISLREVAREHVLGIPPQAKDDEGLWGKTRHHEAKGEHFAVTEFEPRKEDLDYDDPAIKTFAELKKVFELDSPEIRDAILGRFRDVAFISRLLIDYQDLKKDHLSLRNRLDKVLLVLKRVEDILVEGKLPENIEERRETWVAMKKAIGID